MRGKPQRDIGIVLSGGGTRGIAHIGVLRALGERGIFPDCIAGASAGAIVGALYAAGYAPLDVYAVGDRVSPIDGGMFTLDSLLTVD